MSKSHFLTIIFLIFKFLKSEGQLQRHVDYCGVDRLTGQTPDEQKILCKVFKNYTPLLRPVRNWTQSVRVGLSLAINQIFELDERNQLLVTNAWIDQEWTDEFMVWNPVDYGIAVIRIPARYLWLPDIMLYNNGADYINRFVQTRAMVKYDGTVFFPTPVKLYSSCTIDVTYFPFDTQTCWLKFGSWSHDTRFVDIFGRVEDIDLSRFVHNGEWDIVSITHKRHLVHYSCCIELYSDLTFYIKIKRKVLYYFINIFFPSFIMSSLTMLTFLMPPDSGEKLTLGITVLLSFSVFMLSVTEKLPETSEYVPLISIYLCIVLSMICLSITATIFVLSIYYRRPAFHDDLQEARPPRLARRFTELFAREDDIQRYTKREDSQVRQALEEAEIAIKSHYIKNNRRKSTAQYLINKKKAAMEREDRRSSSLTDLLRKQRVFSSIKQFLDDRAKDETLHETATKSSSDDYHHGDYMSLIEAVEVAKLRCDIVRIINRLVSKAEYDTRLEQVILEWKLFSAAVDRVLFVLFVLITGSAIVILLIIMPLIHDYYMSIGVHYSRAGAVEYPEVNATYSWLFYEQQQIQDMERHNAQISAGNSSSATHEHN